MSRIFTESLFLKEVVIKDGIAQFQHQQKQFRVASPCFKDLEGKTVLIDSGMSVFRSDEKIGNAQPA